MRFYRPMPMPLRFAVVFLSTFIFAFGLLNYRYLVANSRYELGLQSQPPASSLPVAPENNKPLPGMAELIIDKIGVRAPIVFGVPGEDQKAIYKNLESGAVHYSTTPKPGQSGMSIVLGHSSAFPWYKGSYGSVFALLSKLSPGDTFAVRYQDGRTFSFKVERAVIFNPFVADTSLGVIEGDTRPSLVLVSCYPVGTNYKRLAVQAVLVK